MRNLTEARKRAHELLGRKTVTMLEQEHLVVVDSQYHDRLKVALHEIQEHYENWVHGHGASHEAMESIGEVLMNAEDLLKGEDADVD